MAKISKTKKTRIIKRVYEKGEETTVSSAKRRQVLTKTKNKPTHNKSRTSLRAIKPRGKKSFNAHSSPPLAAGYSEEARDKKPKPLSSSSPKSSFGPRPVIVDDCDLPARYGTTNVALMVKDPFWLYAYWEIAPDSLESLKNKLSKEDAEMAKIVLRIYDVTLIDFNGSNANKYFDIDVNSRENNWYINIWLDNVSYVGEIGLRTEAGKFIPLARSNYVHAPRISHSPRSEQIWMKVTDETYDVPFVKPAPKTAQTNTISNSSPASKKNRKIINVSEEDVKNYYSRLSSPLREIISARINKLYTGASRKYSFIIEGDTEEERQKIFSSFFPKEYFTKRLPLAGSSRELVVLEKDLQEKISGGASEFVQEKARPRKFFFELDTELIVYGRTEPDAEVKLGEQKINLRPDGTFSLRFALPDGKLPLEFTAVSADKVETRKINTYVERNTTREDSEI